jgi:hypothetical protein
MSKQGINPEEGKEGEEIDYSNKAWRKNILDSVKNYNPDPLSHQNQMTIIRDERNANNEATELAAYKASQEVEKNAAIARNAMTLRGNDEIAARNAMANQSHQASIAADVAARRAAEKQQDDDDYTRRGDKTEMRQMLRGRDLLRGDNVDIENAKRAIPYYAERAEFLATNPRRLEDIKNDLQKKKVFGLSKEEFRYVLEQINSPALLELLFNHPEYYPSTILSTDEVKTEIAKSMTNMAESMAPDNAVAANAVAAPTPAAKPHIAGPVILLAPSSNIPNPYIP